MDSIRKPGYKPHMYRRGPCCCKESVVYKLQMFVQIFKGCQVGQNLLAYKQFSFNNSVAFIDFVVNLWYRVSNCTTNYSSHTCIHSKMYWTDGSTINMANMDGSNSKVLHQNQREPVGQYKSFGYPELDLLFSWIANVRKDEKLHSYSYKFSLFSLLKSSIFTCTLDWFYLNVNNQIKVLTWFAISVFLTLG